MDIRNWPLDKIMQLPDNLFGQHWPVGISVFHETELLLYDISEMALPEVMVIWEMNYIYCQATLGAGECSLALGDVLPTTDAQFDALEPLFRDLGQLVFPRRHLVAQAVGGTRRMNMRKAVHTAGRRLVGRFEFAGPLTQWGQAYLVISSIPKEVPDCLLSGQGRGQ